MQLTEELTVHYAHLYAYFTPTRPQLWQDSQGNARTDVVSRITIAYTTEEVNSEYEVVKYGAAFCSTRDTFSKARGRELAKRRLLASKKVATFSRVSPDKTYLEKIIFHLKCAFKMNRQDVIRGLPRTWTQVDISEHPINIQNPHSSLSE